MDTNKLRARVATLDKLLDDFDGQLDDLLAKSLPETLLGLDTLQQAKLQVTIPYLVYDLVIIYLKTKGIDPKTHPVFRELERVRGYIEKVSKAENHESEQQRMAVDKAAANRFIKHAIAQATRPQGQSSAESADQEPTPGPSKAHAQPVPAGATNKMLARAEWEKEVRETVEEEEEDLEVFEENEGSASADADVEMTNTKAPAQASLPVGTGENASSQQQSATTKKKKKRSKLPLTGSTFVTTRMDTNAEGTHLPTNSPPLPQLQVHTDADPIPDGDSSSKVDGKKRPFPPSEAPTGDSEDPTGSAPASVTNNKKRKRNKKKQKAQAVAGGGETDGTTSQSRSQSRDVSVVSTPQVPTQPLPGVEADAGATGAGEKPRKWRKYNRKKKNANSQPAAETGTQA